MVNEDFFKKRISIDVKTNCWNWTKHRIKFGYGRTHIKNKKYLAHRLSYMYYKGDIGDLHVLHKCDNPSCINPDHLFLGTNKDNMDDRERKGRNGMLGKKGKLHHNSRKVIQYDLNGNFVKKWDCIMDIEREQGLNHSAISACCRGKKKRVKDYIFTYDTYK